MDAARTLCSLEFATIRQMATLGEQYELTGQHERARTLLDLTLGLYKNAECSSRASFLIPRIPTGETVFQPPHLSRASLEVPEVPEVPTAPEVENPPPSQRVVVATQACTRCQHSFPCSVFVNPKRSGNPFRCCPHCRERSRITSKRYNERRRERRVSKTPGMVAVKNCVCCGRRRRLEAFRKVRGPRGRGPDGERKDVCKDCDSIHRSSNGKR